MFKTLSTLLVVSLLCLTACGERPAAKASSSQVAAKVNDDEISTHQINYLLQRAQEIPLEQAEAAKRQALNTLIEQELLVQQALEAKLDRTPAMSIALEAARREVLARGYVEQLQSAVTKPSEAEAKKFFIDNPDLFSNRKLYRIEEASFVAKPENIETVKAQLALDKPVAEIVSQLRARGVEVMGGVSVRPAEKLALDILPKIAQATEGVPQLFVNQQRASIVTVLESKAEPIAEAKARPLIEYFLYNQQKADVLRAELKQLRDKAKIAYMGEFADAKPAAFPSVPTEAAASTTDSAADNANIRQGLVGLK